MTMESLIAAAEIQAIVSGINGDSHVGIAASSERPKIDSECIYIGDDDDIFCGRIMSLFQEIPDDYDSLKLIVAAAAVLIRQNHWYSDDCYTTVQSFTSTVADAKRKFTEFLKGSDSTVFQNAGTIMTYMKINWWITNHNVGSPVISDLLLKVLSSIGINCVKKHKTDPGYKLLWILSHWVDTKGMLTTLGFISGGEGLANFPAPTADIQLRTTTLPAGTAKVGLVLEVMSQLARSLYGKVVPFTFNVIDFLKIAAKVQRNKAAFHPGAAFLGVTAETVPDISEAVEFASAFIHAAQPNGTLSKSRSILPRDQVTATQVYVITKTAREVMAVETRSRDAIVDALSGHLEINRDAGASIARMLDDLKANRINDDYGRAATVGTDAPEETTHTGDDDATA